MMKKLLISGVLFLFLENVQASEWLVNLETVHGWSRGVSIVLDKDGNLAVSDRYPARNFPCSGKMSEFETSQVDTFVKTILRSDMYRFEKGSGSTCSDEVNYKFAIRPDKTRKFGPVIATSDWFSSIRRCAPSDIPEVWFHLSETLSKSAEKLLKACRGSG